MKCTLLALALAFVCGCASQKSSTASSDATQTKAARSKRERIKPELGMSKEEIRASFGKPKHVTINDRGEIWEYDNHELVFIPFNFGFTPKRHVFVFNTEGKLAEFTLGDF